MNMMTFQKLSSGRGDRTCFGAIGNVNRKITLSRAIIVFLCEK
jgi:hypothetical protein